MRVLAGLLLVAGTSMARNVAKGERYSKRVEM
jgi:hypothetical protein